MLRLIFLLRVRRVLVFILSVVLSEQVLHAAPNLRLDSIVVTASPSGSIYAGQTAVTIKVNWTNAGTTATPANLCWTLRTQINPVAGGSPRDTRYCASYNVNESTYTTPFSGITFPSQGQYVVSAQLDVNSELSESNETDNQKNIIIDVLAAQDYNPPPIPTLLSPQDGAVITETAPSLDWSTVSDPEGNGVKYDVQVSTGSSFSNITRSAADQLASGWSVAPALAPGTYYWRVRSKDYIPNVSGWSSPQAFTIRQPNTPPTISLTQPPSNTTVTAGSHVTIAWTGVDPDSTPTVSVGFDADGVFDNGNHTWISLIQPSSGTLDWDTTGVSPGTYSIFATIYDGQSTAYAYAPGQVTIQQPSKPDLVVDSISVAPLVVNLGSKITTTVTVRNAGTASSPPFTLDLRLSTDSSPTGNGTVLTQGIGSGTSLSAGSSIILSSTSVISGVSAGTYYVKANVDPGSAVDESNDTNNIGSSGPVPIRLPLFGTTVITHGFQADGQFPSWVIWLGNAIVNRAGAGRVMQYNKDTGNFDLITSYGMGGETVLLFDWAFESNELSKGYSESAAGALFAALMDGARRGVFSLSHLHFIGHSRGTVVNSEAVERLIAVGQQPEQVTMLDPVDSGYAGLFEDTDVNAETYPGDGLGVVTWTAPLPVVYETYFSGDSDSSCPWHNGFLVDLDGHAIAGSSNLDLTGRSVDHCSVHSWYEFTVDLSAIWSEGTTGDSPGRNWYGSADRTCSPADSSLSPGRRDREGFNTSRLGGLSQPCSAQGSAREVRFDFGSSAEGIVNGDFERGGSTGGTNYKIPGWQLHGGGGPALRNLVYHFLVLDQYGPWRRHDRFYIPQNATSLRYSLGVATTDPDDLIRVDIANLYTSEHLPSVTGWVDRSIDVTSLRGQTVTLTFTLLQGGATFGAKVYVDDVRLVLSGEPAKPRRTYSVPADFNGDIVSDIFWRNAATGNNSIWFESGANPPVGASAVPVPDPNWKIAAIGDFQGDAKSDIVWRNTLTGTNSVWLMDGAGVAASATLPPVYDTHWRIAGTADFQGDGKSDILWRNDSTGANVIWFMDGIYVATTAVLPPVTAPGWTIVGVGDFQGDGKSDILWRNAATGFNSIWLMDGATVAASGGISALPGSQWQVAGVGDFQGDGDSDILWRNSVTGENMLWLIQGLAVIQRPSLPTVISPWTVAKLGDFQGDGKSDILWRNVTTGANALWLMDGGTIALSPSLPTVSDLNWQVVK